MPMQRWLTIANLTWLLVYAAMLAGITWAMFSARSWAVKSLTDDNTTESWQEFRNDSKQTATSGPVLRRVSPSEEPPTLRLLRDHFPASLAATLFFCSALFATLMLMVRGTLGRSSTKEPYQFADVEHPAGSE